MPTFKFIVDCQSTEVFMVEAETLEEAKRNYEIGDCYLRSDEPESRTIIEIQDENGNQLE